MCVCVDSYVIGGSVVIWTKRPHSNLFVYIFLYLFVSSHSGLWLEGNGAVNKATNLSNQLIH